MADHITIKSAPGTWVVRAAGAVLGESAKALELTETTYPPVIYFPRSDIAMAFLTKSDTSTNCSNKGEASYYSIVGKSGTIADAAWSYEAPNAGMEAISGHLAFFTNKVTVERV